MVGKDVSRLVRVGLYYSAEVPVVDLLHLDTELLSMMNVRPKFGLGHTRVARV